MAITIYKSGDKYTVSVSPPDGQLWRAREPMTPRAIFDKLIDLGCHTTDISDAFYAADPSWTLRESENIQTDEA
jgi:hypothetical protein